MLIPLRVALGVTVGTIAAFFIVKLAIALLVGVVGFALSLIIPLLIVGLLVYVVLRVFSPRALNMLRRLGR